MSTRNLLPPIDALDLAFAQEIGAVQFDLCAYGNHADDRRRPPGRNMANDCSAVVFSPIASKEYGTPPPVISFTISTGSALEALIVSVAPICFANPT